MAGQLQCARIRSGAKLFVDGKRSLPPIVLEALGDYNRTISLYGANDLHDTSDAYRHNAAEHFLQYA